MEKKEIAALLLKRVDIKGLLVEDFLKDFVMAKLKEKAASTDPLWDDSLVLMLEPVLVAAAEEFVDSKVAEVIA